jgi:Outer membrane protein Omp28
MKRMTLLISLSVLLISCSKNSPEIPNPVNAPKISSVPSLFNQKIVIEQFTQTSGGQCPKADLILDSLIKYNPGKIYGISIHVDDIMADPFLVQNFSGRNYYDSIFNPLAIYPSGMVNRRINSLADISPDLWAAKAASVLGEVPSCGIAIEAETVILDALTLTVHVGFTATMFGEYRIHAYVVEDRVQSNDSLYDQINDFSASGSTPDTALSLYNLNDTIHNYIHKYVLRKVITADETGSPIPASMMFPGNDYILHYGVDLTGIHVENSSILVFVDKYALTPNGHWIENVQLVPIGESKDWN